MRVLVIIDKGMDRYFMSVVTIIIICLIAEAICNTVASVYAFLGSDVEKIKNTFFHTYNRLLIIVAVACFYIFSSNNVQHLYLVTISFYIYGLICEGIAMFAIRCSLKWIHIDEENSC